MDLKKVFEFIEEKKGYKTPIRFKIVNNIPLNLGVHYKGTLILNGYNIESLEDLKFVE